MTTTGSAAFTHTLKTSSTGVTFSPVSTADLSVSSTGKVTTTGSLGVGTYSISGTDAAGMSSLRTTSGIPSKMAPNRLQSLNSLAQDDGT